MGVTTWNPADIQAGTLSNGNLTFASSGSGNGLVRAVAPQNTGKYYFEINMANAGSTFFEGFGLATAGATWANLNTAATNGALMMNYSNTGNQVAINGTGLYNNPFTGAAGVSTAGIAVDLTLGQIWFRQSAGQTTWNNATGDAAAGTGGYSLGALAGLPLYPVAKAQSFLGNTWVANFGASAFVGTVPAGFLAGWPDTIIRPPIAVMMP